MKCCNLIILTVVSVTVACLSGGAEGSKILILTPFGSRSVRALFSVVAERLVERGHYVTLVSSGEPVPRHCNLTHVLAPHSALDAMDLFHMRSSGEVFKLWMSAFPKVAREMYRDPVVLELWNRRKDFDAIIVNSAANEMAFPFLLNVTAPFITVAPAGTEPLQLLHLGNLVSPAALPSIVVPYDDHMTFWERLVNTLACIVLRYSFRRTVGAPLHEALLEQFPELENPYEVYPRQSVALLNHHHLLDGPVPLLPNQVEVGCITCRDPQPLPQGVAEWVEGAGDAGVAYFSMGSFQNTSKIPIQYRTIIFDALAKLPQRVVMKWRVSSGDGDADEDLLHLPDNVRAYSWLPQQDILGHEKVVVFLSHCGKHSASEALYHGVPILGLPITFDQPRVCARLARRGEACVLQWETLTTDAILKAVANLTQVNSYQKHVKAVSVRLRAQKESGLDKAIWWIEYVIEHGNDYLTFSGAELSLAQYLLLDVLAIVMLVIFVILLILYILLRTICRRIWPSKYKLE